jgi:CRISPR-associated protein Csd1
LRDGYLNGDGESLLRRSVRLSDDTMAVLWADASSDTLDFLTRCFGASSPEDVKTLLESQKAGSKAAPLTARVHCLLLTGGQGRAVVRAYHTGLLRAVESNVGGWFDSHVAFTNRPLPLSWLLRSLAVLSKDENIPPNLAGEIFLAILFGHPFPRWTLTAALGRCRAEQKVPAARMALLYAYLRRNSSNEDVPMSLDPTNTNPGYLLGRTLAILENMQQSAQRQLNKTITDRYYSAASTRPASVFPSLIRLSNHHLAKLSPGLRFHLSKQLGEALAALPAFPPILSLENQGFFALGYYQQKFQRRDSESEIQPVSVEK